jgi:acetylglutamate kinase
MNSAINKADILMEALPYIQHFHGKIIVVKYGGNAMINEELKEAVINDLILMQLVGMRPVIVHGGGPEINQMLEKLEIKSQFINGLRVTSPEIMEVVEMVLKGKINSQIVSCINNNGGKAVGLSGKDANLFTCEQFKGKEELGLVGAITDVNTDIPLALMDDGYLPVISPIGGGKNGETFNTNADYAAGRVAEALKAEKLILLTDVEGLYADWENKKDLISVLHAGDVPDLMENGIISGGMIPKVKCCVNALNAGVTSAHILDGRQPHSLLLEIFTKEGIGTMVTNSEK